MSTFDSGTLSVRIFVASSPSIPGMRTSMITTFGLRRSVSSTAEAPSAASPITRMCGARESDSRRPSRTTSWSSTISVVISSAMGSASLRREQAELFVGLRGPQLHDPAVPDTVFLRQATYEILRRACARLREVGAARVQPVVLREQFRPVALEAAQEVLARPRPQVEEVRPDPARARLARGRDDTLDGARLVGEAWKERRHPDRRPYPGLDERRERPQALPRRGGPRLGRA